REMRILTAILLVAAVANAEVFFSATAHHEGVVAGVKKEHTEAFLLKEFRSIFGQKVNEVFIDSARTSSLDASSVLVDIVIAFEAEISRDEILRSIEDTPIRFMRLSEAHPRPPPPRSFSLSTSILDSSSSVVCSGHGIKLPNETCVCDNFWVGSQCDSLMCFGGVASDGRCSCPPGRFAEHCQPQTCMPPMNDNLSLKQRSIVIAVNLRNTMARDLQYMIPDLGSAMGDLVRDHPSTYDNFVLYTYLAFGDKIVDDVYVTSDITLLAQMMMQMAISKGNDRQPTLGALRKAINASPLIHPRSIIMLFADSLPSDSTDWAPTETDQTEEVLLIEQILAFGHRLVITLTDQPDSPLDPEDQDFESLDRVTNTVHGDLIHTAKTDIAQTTQYLTPLLHQSENVFIKSRFTCGQEMDTIVEIDKGITDYYVAFAGTNTVQLFASGTDGKESQITAKVLVQNFAVFKVSSSLTTIRVVTPTNSAPFCSFRVFVQSPDVTFVSFSNDENIDVGAATATQGALQQLTFFSSQPLRSHKIQMRDMNGNNLGTTKDLNMRPTTCAFTLKTVSDATCMAGPIHMKVWAVGDDGQRVFTRVIPAMCERPAAREPAPWVCLNGGTVVPTATGGQACQCARLFDGAHCETPQCHNGASRNQFPVDGAPLCLCQIGWAGRHCETLADCPESAESDFALADRQFVLVIQVTYSQNFIFDDLIAALGKITTTYGSYVLVTYNRASSSGQPYDNIARYEFSTVQGMIDQLNTVKYVFAAADEQPIAKAVARALGNKTNRNDAVVFVITDTTDLSTDADIIDMKQATTQAGAPLHIIRTKQFGDTCPVFDDKKIISFARETGGVYVDACAKGSNNAEVTQTITSLASHPTSTQLVDAQLHFYEDCKDLSFVLPYRANDDAGLFVRIVSQSTLDTVVTAGRFDADLSEDTTDSPVIFTDLPTTKKLSMNTVHEWSLPIDIGDLGIDRFQATVTVKSGGGCGVYLYAHSLDSLWYSYGEMERDTKSRSADFAQATFPRIHIQPEEESNLTPGADFFVYDLMGNQTYESSAGELRGNCSYEVLYPNAMSCPVHDGSYIVQSTISRMNTLVKRTWFAYCGLKVNQNCVNGDWDVTGTMCECNPNYEGDYCEVPKCVHGVADNSVCACEKMYTGTFCEYAMCDALDFWTCADERARDFRSVTFIMELTNNAITANLMFQPSIADVVNSIDSGSTKQFNLITYDDFDVSFAASSSVASQFISEFTKIIDPSNHKQILPANTVAFTAIDQAMQLNVAQPNLIVAFVSASSAFKQDEFNRMRNQHPGVQVNIIYVPTTADPMLPTASPYYLYEASTYMSGGRVIPSTQINTYFLPEVIKSMATENVLITAEGASDCTGNGYTATFDVESTGNRLVVLIMGSDVTPASTIVKFNGVVTEFNIRQELFADTSAYSFKIAPLWNYPKGQWSVTVKTSKGRCTVQARVASSVLQTEIGFVSDPHNDYVNDLPFSGNADKDHESTRFALTIPSDKPSYVTFTKASLYDFDFTSGKRTKKTDVSIGLRDYGGISSVNPGCAYQFISEPFTFPGTYTAIVVSGYDQYKEENIQRTFIVSNQQQVCNGGQFSVTGECICPEGFTGDACDQAACANGGSGSGSICVCTSGYTGPHCEEIISPNPTTTTKTTTIATTTVPTTPGQTQTAETGETETTVPTTTTIPTTTKTIPICYPDATSYNIAMFIENSKMTYNVPEAATNVILGLAAQYHLGVDLTRSRTLFMMNGVNKEYFYGGTQQSDDDITKARDAIEDSLDGTNMNQFALGNALNKFMNESMSDFVETKPFAVVFSGIASTDDATAYVQELKDLDYNFVGIAYTDDSERYLKTIMTDVYRFTNDVNAAANFIVKATCAV
ncbi:hypothetical protein PFISCL1PPCAC_24491, partial [Pristionchus fissidentatus]